MIKIGLTGGIGTGKSIVSHIFSELGISVFYADMEAKKAYLDEIVLLKVRDLIGDVVFEQETLNLQKLAKIVFADKIVLTKLNSIIHPYTMDLYDDWVGQHKEDVYTIMESAIIFEADIHKQFDKIITVDAPVEICIKRVMERDNISKESVIQRMESQFATKFKTERSDFVIINDNNTLILQQVLDIHNTLIF